MTDGDLDLLDFVNRGSFRAKRSALDAADESVEARREERSELDGEVNELEFERDQLENDLEDIDAEIEQRERRLEERATLETEPEDSSDRVEELRSRMSAPGTSRSSSSTTTWSESS